MEMTTKGGRREWRHGKWRFHFEGRDRNDKPLAGTPIEGIPPGPWDNEPDKIQWVDETTGLDCLMVRNWWGSWCGYVGVPEGHPLYEVGTYDESPALIARRDARLKEPADVEHAGLSLLLAILGGEVAPSPGEALSVHGGVTFTGFCHEPTEEEWIENKTNLTLHDWREQEMARRICHVPEPGRPTKVWWIGFDCGHSGDLQPSMAASMRKVLGRPSVLERDGSTYRTVEYVEGQVARLAKQLHELTGETK